MPDFIRGLRGPKLSPQLSDEDVDLEQFFTDAEHACQVFEQMVGVEKPPKHLLVIHGVGGVGKSTLLKMYRLSCRRRHIPVALVGGEEAPSPVDVLADWAADLSDDGIKLYTFQATLTHCRALQAKVEAEAKKASQAAEKLGKAVAKTAVEMAASAIPVVGPLASAVGGAGAEAFVDWLRGFLSKPDLELYLDPTQRLTDDFVTDLRDCAMKIYYDAEVDALYIEFHSLADGTAEARPLSDELIANYGPDGKLAGLEILDAGQVLGQVEGRIVFEIAPALAVAASS